MLVRRQTAGVKRASSLAFTWRNDDVSPLCCVFFSALLLVTGRACIQSCINLCFL